MKTESFTASQQEAINTTESQVLLLAGPGSGKTSTIVARINKVIEDGVPPEKIVVLTFTNASAREIEERIERSCDGDVAVSYMRDDFPLGYVGTLHGFALRCLKEHGTDAGYGARVSIISPGSAADLILSKAQSLGSRATIKDLLTIKATGLPPRGAMLTVDQTVIAAYYDDLASAGVVDFDVLLEEFSRLIPAMGAVLAQEYTHLFVDEVQDSATIDWKIYDGLPVANKFYVGDPDQAIYSFRGGDVGLMEATAKQPGVKVIRLEENFRSRVVICEAAQRLIEHNLGRIPKRTIPVHTEIGTVFHHPGDLNEGAEIAHVGTKIKLLLEEGPNHSDPSEIAILARTNDIAMAFQKTLKAWNIPVVERAKSDLPKDWPMARALIEFLSNTENDTLAFLFMIQLLAKRGVPSSEGRRAAHAALKAAQSAKRSLNLSNLGFQPEITLSGLGQVMHEAELSLESRMVISQAIRDLSASSSMMDLALYLASTREVVKESNPDGISVLTIHGAKGREWDNVFLVGFEEEVIPGKRKNANIEEERRLAYVAVTRARDRLWIMHSLSRVTAWGAIVQHHPSRFIEEMSS